MARGSRGTFVERNICTGPESSELAEKEPSRVAVPAGQIRQRLLELVRIHFLLAEGAQPSAVSICDDVREILKLGCALLVEAAVAAFVEKRGELLAVGASRIQIVRIPALSSTR